MVKRTLLLAALLASLLLLAPTTAHAADRLPPGFMEASSLATPPAVVNVSGADRFLTAVAASKLAYPGKASTIVLATGFNWPDALGGAALAGAERGPLLLTRPDRLSSCVVTEAVRLDARRVIILGSPSAVCTAVADALASLTVNGHSLEVTRVAGADRFETAALVASATVAATRRNGGTYDGSAFFATGHDFPDALAASPLAARKGWPILLVRASAVPTPTAEAIPSLGVTRGIVLGSERAVDAGVLAAIGGLGGEAAAAPTRVAGADRYLTAIAVARFGVAKGLSYNGVGITTGRDYPDALAGGVMQGKLGSVVLLTPPDQLAKSVFDEMTAKRASIYVVRYFGGRLQQYARDAVTAACTGKPYPYRGGMIFPVRGGDVYYENDFGAPRSGGRTHEGCDILAPRNTPCVAILPGTVTTKTNTLGGNVLYLQADNGWRFYYAHLERYAVISGHVSAGQVVAYVGNSGNASGGPTHLHLQMWKPDGTLVNPYPYLNTMQR